MKKCNNNMGGSGVRSKTNTGRYVPGSAYAPAASLAQSAYNTAAWNLTQMLHQDILFIYSRNSTFRSVQWPYTT